MKMMFDRTKVMKNTAILLFSSLIIVTTFWASTSAQEAVESLKEKDAITVKDFKQKKSSLLLSLEKNKNKVLEEKKGLEEKTEQMRTVTHQLRNEISTRKGVLLSIKYVLGLIRGVIVPVIGSFSWLSFVADVVGIFFFITVLNLFLYFYYKEKELFKKHRKIIIITLWIVLILAFPAFGEESITEEATIFKKRDPFVEKLDIVNELLQWDDLKKMIHILEEKKIKPVISLPGFKGDNSFLKPWKEVRIDNPEYFFTLASLYFQNGKTGKAVVELKKIFQIPPDVFKRNNLKDEYNKMLINSIHFLIEQNMTKAASEAAQKTVPIIDDVPVLLEISDFLYQKNMHDSAGEFLKKAVKIAGKNKDRLELADFLLKRERIGDAIKTIEESIKVAENPNEVVDILNFIFEKKLISTTDKAIDRGLKLSKNASDYLVFAEFLLGKKRMEDTSRALKEALSSIRGRFPSMEKDLLDITKFALKHQFYEEAGDAVEKLMVALKRKSFSYFINPSGILDSERFLPTEDQITLPIYFGAIRQKAGLIDDAQKYYERAVSFDLDRIIGNFGYDVKGNLNNFFYLKELLKLKGDTKKWGKLEPLYSKLESDYLAKKQMEYSAQIEAVQKELERQKNTTKETEKTIKTLKNEKLLLNFKILFQSVRIPAFLAVFAFVMIGAAAKSYQEAKQASRFKAFSFSWKFIETWGWFYVFTIIGIPIGVILIFIGQLLGSIARIQQDEEKKVGLLERRVAV